MKNEINYLVSQNPNREIPQGNILNNTNEMNKLLDLYDEYLRRGENIYLLMFKLSNNILPMSNIQNNSEMKNSPNNNFQIINLPNNNYQDNNGQMRILQDNHSQMINL